MSYTRVSLDISLATRKLCRLQSFVTISSTYGQRRRPSSRHSARRRIWQGLAVAHRDMSRSEHSEHATSRKVWLSSVSITIDYCYICARYLELGRVWAVHHPVNLRHQACVRLRHSFWSYAMGPIAVSRWLAMVFAFGRAEIRYACTLATRDNATVMVALDALAAVVKGNIRISPSTSRIHWSDHAGETSARR